jgi:hypothetical protein
VAGIWDARVLPDGRVGALVAYGSASEVQTRFVFFVHVGDRWLVADVWSQVMLCMLGVDVAVPAASATPVAREPSCSDG